MVDLMALVPQAGLARASGNTGERCVVWVILCWCLLPRNRSVLPKHQHHLGL